MRRSSIQLDLKTADIHKYDVCMVFPSVNTTQSEKQVFKPSGLKIVCQVIEMFGERNVFIYRGKYETLYNMIFSN